MENSIEIFRYSTNELDKNTVYVTDQALGYFLGIRNVLDNIANDLVILLTGAPSLTPENFKLTMELTKNIDNLENFLRSANRNSAENSSRVIDVRSILIAFDNIRSLMRHPNTNGNFRWDAIELFLKIGNLYPEEQIREFIGWLNEEELQHILQIIAQEKTLMERPLTDSLIHILASQRMNLLRTKAIEGADSEFER